MVLYNKKKIPLRFQIIPNARLFSDSADWSPSWVSPWRMGESGRISAKILHDSPVRPYPDTTKFSRSTGIPSLDSANYGSVRNLLNLVGIFVICGSAGSERVLVLMQTGTQSSTGMAVYSERLGLGFRLDTTCS